MPECERCDRWFGTERALRQHKEDSPMHHICDDCDRDFTTAYGLIQHYTQSPRHAYCRWCDEHFDDLDDLREHYDDAHWYCDACNQVFTYETGLHEHRRQRHADRYCVPCRRIFQTANALRQHQLTSAQHRSRAVICPMKGCGRAFPSLAALVLHLEAGTCASGMTRKMVDDIVRKLDKTHFVTKPNRRAIEAPPEGEVTGEWATERAWNGAAYECYWCHQTFATLRALNAHLRSPAHAEKIYRCPPRQSGCGAEFGTLSAFCQHMESGSCDVFRFKKAFERLLDRFPTSVGRLGAVQKEAAPSMMRIGLCIADLGC